MAKVLIGNIKGPKGDTGATGATGAAGTAATVDVGSVTTTAYGNPAQVTNSGTSEAAVFDFVIPQGKPGEATTTMGSLTLDAITTSTANLPSPQIGDTGATAWGKVVKFFADIIALLNGKLNTANVANNLTTTEAGYALDARQGKTLLDRMAGSYGQITAADGVTVGSVHSVGSVGDMVAVNVVVTIAETFATNTDLVIVGTSFRPDGTRYLNCNSGGNPFSCYMNANGRIKNSGSWPAGTYTINGAFYKTMM